MELGKHVMDKALLDRTGRRAGTVDDLLLEVPDPAQPSAGLPRVAAIMAGPLAAARTMPGPAEWIARQFYRLLGVRDPRPVALPWSLATRIDVVVHVDLDRDTAGLTVLSDAVARQVIRHLPGS
jgi:hypothetical protein